MSTMSNQSSDIAEDTPQYRSVMIAPSIAPPLPRAFSAAPMKSLHRLSETIKVQQSTSLSVWTVAELTALPSMHLLERTNVYVNNSTAQEIANRIVECLRAESIAATFDCEDKNRLIADTKDSVQFVVRLFADQGQVVVEAQRMCGCSFLFHQAAKAVLRSAKGLSTSTPKRKFALPSCIPKETKEEKQQRMEEGLQIAFKLLKKDGCDAHLLAMESLEQLTRATDCRAFAARSVLCSEYLDNLISLIESSHASDSVNDMEEKHISIMRRQALTVLANSLSAVEESGELLNLLNENAQLTSKSLFAALISNLEASAERSHEACQSARCVRALVLSKLGLESFEELGASTALFSACAVGACRNAMLEQESRKLRLQLNM